MKIVEVEVGRLRPSEYNPRMMTENEVKDLTESIRRFGLVDPLLVNRHSGRENVVIGGHQRLKIASSLGFSTVPVVFLDLDEKRERELNLRLNRNLGGWDWDLLANFDKELLLDVGFEEPELNKYFQIDIVEDDVPEPRPNPNVKLGDLFQLGNHRLLCGDATKKEDVERLMDGQKADMVFTDPPYGVDYEGKTKDALKIANDKNTNAFSESIPLWPLRGGGVSIRLLPGGQQFQGLFVAIRGEAPSERHCDLGKERDGFRTRGLSLPA